MPVPDQRRPLIAIAFVAVAWLAFRVLGQDLSPAAEGLLKVGLWVVPCFVAVRWSTGLSWRGLTRALGLAGSMWGGIAFGVLATLPILAIVAARAPRSPGVVYILSFQLWLFLPLLGHIDQLLLLNYCSSSDHIVNILHLSA